MWRARNPDLRHYTYFSYRFNCREKGLGWRLDMCTCAFPSLLLFLCVRAGAVWGRSVVELHCGTLLGARGSIAVSGGSLTCLRSFSLGPPRSRGERAAGGAGQDV